MIVFRSPYVCDKIKFLKEWEGKTKIRIFHPSFHVINEDRKWSRRREKKKKRNSFKDHLRQRRDQSEKKPSFWIKSLWTRKKKYIYEKKKTKIVQSIERLQAFYMWFIDGIVCTCIVLIHSISATISILINKRKRKKIRYSERRKQTIFFPHFSLHFIHWLARTIRKVLIVIRIWLCEHTNTQPKWI